MKPLSKKKRSWYMVLLMLLFVVVAPILIMYASGYRLDKTFNIATTGGIYIGATQSGTEIYLGNELVRTTSIFQKSVFVQNLKPGSYDISVRKNEYQEWKKTLRVFPETVTEAYSFLFPLQPKITEIPQKISAEISNGATATGSAPKTVPNPDYADVVLLFDPPKKTLVLPKNSTTTGAIEFRKLLVIKDKGNLKITWDGEVDSKPAYFCQDEICKDEIFIKPTSRLISFDFFPGRGDLIIMSLESGIYVSEIDDRSTQNVQKLFDGPNADFRIKDGDKIFFKKDKKFYSIAL
jgi:hypothetical protein